MWLLAIYAALDFVFVGLGTLRVTAWVILAIFVKEVVVLMQYCVLRFHLMKKWLHFLHIALAVVAKMLLTFHFIHFTIVTVAAFAFL